MWMSSNATEEKPSGSDKVDSVVLRIMIQQDDCICRVNIENQIELVHIGLGKYGSLTSSAPVDSQCGLAGLFQKRVVRTKFDFYVFISFTNATLPRCIRIQ
jgi:hypothetical protein